MSTGEPLEKRTAVSYERLLEEFEITGYDDWHAEVERLLKGVPFEKRMQTKTIEGITLKPIYTKEDTDNLPDLCTLPGFAPYLRGSKSFYKGEKNWEISQAVSSPTPDEFNKALRSDLKRGLTGVVIPLDRASRNGMDPESAPDGEVGCDGVSITSLSDMAHALEGTKLNQVPVFIQTGISGLPYLAQYVALAKKNGINLTELKGAIAFDPLGELAQTGRLKLSMKEAYDEMAVLTVWATDNASGVGTVWVHGEPYSDSGAGVVQELAFVLATAVEYLRELEKRDLDIERFVSHFRFSFGLGTNFFMETAKLRAARLLWAHLLKACKVTDAKQVMWMHVRSSRYYQTRFDPYVNLLRLTTEAFAGVVGGADSIQVASFDEVVRPADEFSRRLSRNIQIILNDEAKLAKIIDPAGGSWYVEWLTHEIALKTWELFQEIENKGGMSRALADGFPQNEIKKTVADRNKAFAVRKDILVGTNKYPNPVEEPLKSVNLDYKKIQADRIKVIQKQKSSSLDKSSSGYLEEVSRLTEKNIGKVMPAVITAVEQGATIGELMKALRPKAGETVNIEPLKLCRGAEPFEKLRLAVEKYRSEKGGLKVYLATLGPVGLYMPRFDFATSFFDVGGFEVVRTGGHDTPTEAANAALKAKAKVVLICGLDEAYPEGVPVVAGIVKKARPDSLVVLAGQPADDELKKRFNAAGVDVFIHIKANVLEVLNEIALKAGVSL